jgi:hypothetical protein
MRSSRESAEPPGERSCPFSSKRRTPSARNIPLPPSLVALPPRPTTIVVAPVSSAATINCPVPALLARLASRSFSRILPRPDAAAISTIAVEPSTANAASTSWPSASSALHVRRRYPFATRTSIVPSPPSAIGTRIVLQPLRPYTDRQPSAIARAAFAEVRVPLNLSGATTTTGGGRTIRILSAP